MPGVWSFLFLKKSHQNKIANSGHEMGYLHVFATVSRIKVRKPMDAPPIESSDSRDSRLKSRLWPWKRQLPGLPRSGLRRSNVRGKLQPKLSIWKLRPDRLGFLDEFLWVEGVVDWWWLLATGIKPKIGCLMHLNAVKTKTPLKGYPKKNTKCVVMFYLAWAARFLGISRPFKFVEHTCVRPECSETGYPQIQSLSCFLIEGPKKMYVFGYNMV